MPDFLHLPNLRTLAAQDTRTTIRKKTRKAVERPVIGFATPVGMSRMTASPVSYEDIYEDVTLEYGPYIPTLARKLEAGDFA